MKLVSFRGRKIHGYLNFNVRFKKRLTFLIGLNGSGKTTVVRSVHALMDPRLAILATTQHDLMQLVVETDAGRLTIESRSTNAGTVLTVSGVAEPLEIPAFVLTPAEPSYRLAEFESKYYEELGARYAGHPVVQYLATMATPMYLGIERRAALGSNSEALLYRHRMPRNPALRYGRTVFSGSLLESLDQAEALASRQYQTALQAERAAANALRQKFIAAAFEFVESTPYSQEGKFPTEQERAAIMARRGDVETTLASLETGSTVSTQQSAI